MTDKARKSLGASTCHWPFGATKRNASRSQEISIRSSRPLSRLRRDATHPPPTTSSLSLSHHLLSRRSCSSRGGWKSEEGCVQDCLENRESVEELHLQTTSVQSLCCCGFALLLLRCLLHLWWWCCCFPRPYLFCSSSWHSCPRM